MTTGSSLSAEVSARHVTKPTYQQSLYLHSHAKEVLPGFATSPAPQTVFQKTVFSKSSVSFEQLLSNDWSPDDHVQYFTWPARGL